MWMRKINNNIHNNNTQFVKEASENIYGEEWMTKIFARRTNKCTRQLMCAICTSALAGWLLCSSRRTGSQRQRNVEQLTYAETSAKLVNKLTHGHFAALVQRSDEQLLPLKSFSPLVPLRRLDATVIPPHTEADTQRGIIDTSQLQRSTTTVAQ